MRPRDYIIPLTLLGAIAGFVGYQAVETRRSMTAGPTAAAPSPAAPPRAGGPPPPPSQPGNPPALSAPAGEVTVQASTESAPPVDAVRVRDLLREGSAGTYLPQLLAEMDSSLVRWPDRRTAMRVWIERNAQLPDWDPQYPAVAERAFQEWQEAGFPLRFDMVLEPDNVDIQIVWIERFPPEEGRKIGLAKKVRDQHGWLVSAEISIATHDRLGRPLPPAIVAGTTRHEIGHALGLGHSGDPSDVMYPESRTPIISTADRKTLRLLYMLPPGRIP